MFCFNWQYIIGLFFIVELPALVYTKNEINIYLEVKNEETTNSVTKNKPHE